MIESFQNPKLKSVRQFFENAHFRKKADFFVAENLNAIQDILQKDPHRVQYILSSSPEISASIRAIAPQISIFEVSTSILDQMTSLKTHQGIMAVLDKNQDQQTVLENLLKKISCHVVLLDSISNPSNFGAIVRTAAAYELSAVLYTQNTVDPYHPQSVRAMAGTLFQIPFLEINDEILLLLIQNGFQFYTLIPHQGTSLTDASFGAKSVFVFGSEAHGIVNPTIQKIAQPLHIEMAESVDSLNVAVSSGILFYNVWQKI